VNLANGVRNAKRGVVQESASFGKEFDDDGLRLAGKIADHVGKQLHEFDLGCRLFGAICSRRSGLRRRRRPRPRLSFTVKSPRFDSRDRG